MPTNQREIQKRQTLEKIKRSALEMFASHGLLVSIARIAEHAGITKQALMYHFPSKNELISAVMHDIEQDSLESMIQFFSLLLTAQNVQNEEKLEQLVGYFLENSLWSVLFLRLILENAEGYLPESFRQNHVRVIRDLEKLQQQGKIKKHIDVAATWTNMNMLLLTTLATSQVESTLTQSLEISPERWLKRRIVSIFWMYRSTIFPN